MDKEFEDELYKLCEKYFGNDFEFNWTEEEGEGNASGFRCTLDVWGQKEKDTVSLQEAPWTFWNKKNIVWRSG